LFLRDVHPLGDLGVRRFAAELLEEHARPLADAVQRAGAIERNAHDAALLRQRLENGLPDPPDRVRDELDPLRLVELVCGADQAEVALVDQVGQRHALILVLLRHADDEAQVGAHELVERLLVALANALGERHLVFPRDERVDADVAQVLIERALFERRLLAVRSGGHAGVPRGAAAPRWGGGEGSNGCGLALRVQCTRSPSRVHRTWVSHAKSLEESGAKLKYTTSGRPRSSESGTNPQYRLSSELSRLSPRTKYCASGTTNGPQLFRDGWYATIAPAVFTRKLPCHRNSSHTGSASGSLCDTYGSASATPFRMRMPSRIASVSPGKPTSRLTKFLLRSFGHSNTITSPRWGRRSPGSRL